MREGTTSFALNKRAITLCLKTRDGSYYDSNTIAHVALHELAHIITPVSKSEHGKEFQANFRALESKAKKLGYYDPRKPLAEMYCGIAMNSKK
jgi:hypothetical protein